LLGHHPEEEDEVTVFHEEGECYWHGFPGWLTLTNKDDI
jgi:hypothetical protein